MASQYLRMRHVAPAGAPIRVGDLARWTGVALTGGDLGESIEEAFRSRFGVRHCFLTSTGRAGLTVLLRGLRRLGGADRDEVILPTYTCYSVAASVVKAGLKPRLVDVSPETLDYVPSQLVSTDFRRVLAVIATNLYGLPNDLPFITRVARQHGAFVVDDAAQAMGATTNGRASGTWGDAGLYSLDKGKNVSAIDGGVVVTNSDDVAGAVRLEMQTLAPASWGASTTGVVKAVAYFAMLRPWLYWIPNRIPQLELGQTVFTTEFPLARPARALVALGCTMVRRLDDFTAVRVANAQALRARISGLDGVQFVRPAPETAPVYLRLPLLLRDADTRTRVLTALNQAGIGATASYPDSLADVPGLAARLAGPPPAAEGGRAVARRIATLPTHGFVSGADVNRASDVLARTTS
jgi:perosamine synthetase